MTPAPDSPLSPPVPASVLEVASSDGVRLHVETHGRQDGGAPPVVLIHGWTCSIRLWAPVIRALSGRARVIAYDQRGHGRSGRPGPGGYSTQALADDLAAVLEATLAPGERAVLAGHSMGGMAIMAAAGRAETLGRVSGVLLASTGCASLVNGAFVLGRHGPARLAGVVHHAFMTSAGPLPPTPLTRAALAFGTLGPGAARDVAAANAAIICACDRKVRAAWGRVLTTLDLTDAARSLDAPARVLVGSADRLTPPRQARRIAGLLPRCEGLTELPGAGHMTPLEAPGEVADQIAALMESPESAV